MGIRALLVFGVMALNLISAESPFSGTWRVNYSKSEVPGTDRRDHTVVVVVDDHSIRLNSEEVVTQGDPVKLSYEAQFDGKDYPVKGSQDLETVAFQRVNPNHLHATFKKDGKVVWTQDIVVSRDRRTTTVKSSGLDENGKHIHGTAVYDRQ